MKRVKTKIIATLGPASSHPAELRKMIHSGLDIARLNFSHGNHASHIRKIETLRILNRKMKRAVKILQDLEGYRIRIGKLEKPFELKKRQVLTLVQNALVGNERFVSFDYEGSMKVFKKGTKIYIDDGKVTLEVIGNSKRSLRTRVLVPGLLKSNKGINIPGVRLDFEGLTEKDRRDVEVAIRYKLDFVAQSFVRNANDLKMLKRIVKPKRPNCKIFAKIESQEALENLDEIIYEADGVMVARGDLGICVPIYKVPLIQKEIIKRCRLRHKPVVVATQMLDSMTESNLPTRAEVSDVANAVLDRATHLLLSGETAVGKSPHQVVRMMNTILKHTEAYQERLRSLEPSSLVSI